MMIEITNVILKRLYQSDLEVDLDLRLDETVANAIQIQINVKPKYFNDFAIFYGTKDTIINFASIFEVKDKNDLNIQKLFDKDCGIYESLIIDEDDEMVHLYGFIELDDIVYVDEEHLIDDSFIFEIIKYLSEEHELTNYLNSIYE